MSDVLIHEVGLRDGLQMEKQVVPIEIKLKWIDLLVESGVDVIQLGSFVHPKKVPQMADTDELFKISKKKYNKTVFSGLVLNEKGLERGVDCGVDMFCMGVSASETHSKKNTGMSTDEALMRIIKMAKEAESLNKTVQVSVQSAFGCGFAGKIDEDSVYKIIDKYIENGLNKISLADTAGHAYPEQVKRMIRNIKEKYQTVNIAVHIHNTYGLGIANCYAAIDAGAEIIETAFGGLGGCPFTKQAAGNVCTEDFVHGLQRNGIREDIQIEKLIDLSKSAEIVLEKELQGFIYKSGCVKY